MAPAIVSARRFPARYTLLHAGKAFSTPRSPTHSPHTPQRATVAAGNGQKRRCGSGQRRQRWSFPSLRRHNSGRQSVAQQPHACTATMRCVAGGWKAEKGAAAAATGRQTPHKDGQQQRGHSAHTRPGTPGAGRSPDNFRCNGCDRVWRSRTQVRRRRGPPMGAMQASP